MVKFLDEVRDCESLSFKLVFFVDIRFLDVLCFFSVSFVFLGVPFKLIAPEFMSIRMHCSR